MVSLYTSQNTDQSTLMCLPQILLDKDPLFLVYYLDSLFL